MTFFFFTDIHVCLRMGCNNFGNPLFNFSSRVIIRLKSELQALVYPHAAANIAIDFPDTITVFYMQCFSFTEACKNQYNVSTA